MSQTPESFTVVYAGDARSSVSNLLKLAEFMGVSGRGESLSASGSAAAVELARIASKGPVGISTQALRQVLGDFAQWREAWRALRRAVPFPMFIFGFDGSAEDGKLVEVLSEGGFVGLRGLEEQGAPYVVASEARDLCGEFAGLRFGRANKSNDILFEKGPQAAGVTHLVEVAGCGLVAGIGKGAGLVMLAGTREILDIDGPLRKGWDMLDSFASLVPALWFLRHSFGRAVWRAACRQACFIVDDPLLRSRHGFLKYESLLKRMEQSEFATSLAFIPWNWRRSDPKVARLFQESRGRLSLSVHGCDHNKGEFGGPDETLLLQKARVAQSRMARHEKLTGVHCDNVMVFPQGAFSSTAMKALKKTNYLAAVNSSPFSTDDGAKTLRIRDIMEPAVMHYSTFPLFIRRYPTSVAAMALDLFLGKPGLMVEHHEYFKNGYEELHSFVQQVNQLGSGLLWRGLETITRHSSQWRETGNGSVCVRFFANEMEIQNSDSGACQIHFWRAWDPADPAPPVSLNGQPVTVEQFEGGLLFQAELQAGQTAQVRVRPPSAVAEEGPAFGNFSYRAKVFARRHMCEFRDNFVSPGRAILRNLGNGTKHTFKNVE